MTTAKDTTKSLELMRVVLLVACLGCASSVSAQPPDWTAYTVMVAGNVADLWTTHTALATGRAHEGNPVLSRRGIGTVTAVKTCGVVMIGAAMRLLERHGHPTVAKVIGYVDAGVTFSAALHNRGVVR